MLVSRSVLTILLTVSVCSNACLSLPRVDPEKGIIRTLFIGDAFLEPYFPAPLLIEDPMMDMTLVPAQIGRVGLGYLGTITKARRMIRIYLPRTKQDLWSTYDVVMMAAVQADYLSPEFQTWVRDGVMDDGMGFIMGDDPASFGGIVDGINPNPSWASTPIGEILSVECATDRKDWGSSYFEVIVVEPENPMVRGLDWTGLRLRAHNRVYDREGTEIVIRAKNVASPVLAWWKVGNGRSISLLYDWGKPGCIVYRWPDLGTFYANLVYYSAQVAIPEDTELMKLMRNRIIYFSSLNSYVVSLSNFADKFGANTKSIYKALEAAYGERRKVEKLFVAGDFNGAIDSLEKAIEIMSEISMIADNAMNRALFWVYLSEWFVVAGTSMMCGFVIWSLMIRRTKYKEVETTRLGTEGG